MTKQQWKVLTGLSLVIATAFLIGAIALGTTIFYVAASIWFALAAYMGRKASKTPRNPVDREYQDAHEESNRR